MVTEVYDDIIKYIDQQIQLYDSKSSQNHKKWYTLVFITIAGAAFGGLCAAVKSENLYIRFALGVPSVLASVAAAINSAVNYRGERVRQASTSEALKSELLRFHMKLKPYDGQADEGLKILTGVVLAITGKEVASWAEANLKASQPSSRV